MRDYEILTSGEKIKKIRKEYNLKQYEITGDKITRNLISLIENNKAKLSLSTAEIISNNINNICAKKNINFNISSEELLETDKSQAQKIVKDFADFIDNNLENNSCDFSKEIKNIDELFTQYNLPEEKALLYIKIGDYYKFRNDYNKSYIFYIKAYENISINSYSNTCTELILKLSFCCIELQKYRESINIINIALNSDKNMSSDLKYKLLFNKAKAYKYLKDYKKSIEQITLIEKSSFMLLPEDKFDLLTLKANCYKNMCLYKNALDIQKNLLESILHKDITKKLIVLCNIIDIYMSLNDIKNIRKSLKTADKIIKNYNICYDSNYSYLIYYQIGEANLFIKEIDISIIYFKETLNWAKSNHVNRIMYKCIENLFYIYRQNNSYYDLESLKTEYLEFLIFNRSEEYFKLLFEYYDIYLQNKDFENITGINQFILKLYDKTNKE